MQVENLLTLSTRDDLRHWLLANGNTTKCCWVVVSMLPAPDKLLYLDAVEEALCFGWIDGVKKKISAAELAQRLSPRSTTSSWTELNKERVRRLEKLGLMSEDGRRVFPEMGPDAFVIDSVIEERLKADKAVYENYLGFPDLYRRVRIDTIQSCRSQPALYNSRLDKFIANTKDNKIYGAWHDQGRLLDY